MACYTETERMEVTYFPNAILDKLTKDLRRRPSILGRAQRTDRESF